MPHALVVDDDHDSAASLRELIAGEQFTVAVAHNLRDARRQISLQQPDILLLDLRLPDGNGMDLLADPKLVANSEVVLCTGHANLETSIQALRLGAADYLVKPVNLKQLQGVLSRIMKPAALQAEVEDLTANLDESGHFAVRHALSGRCPQEQPIGMALCELGEPGGRIGVRRGVRVHRRKNTAKAQASQRSVRRCGRSRVCRGTSPRRRVR